MYPTVNSILSPKKKGKIPQISCVFITNPNPAQKTNTDIILELNHGNEGLDLHISQTVCDDGRPNMGEEAQSYFLMRHSFLYPGPLTTMMQGPAAMSGATTGYRVSAEAVKREKYVLVGTLANNTIEGVWEHTWSRNLKTHLIFVAGFESLQQRQMAMMMGGAQGPRFPAAIAFVQYRMRNFSTRLHLDMMHNQLSLSFNRRFGDRFQCGTRISSNYDQRKTLVEFGGKYEWNGSQGKKGNDSKSMVDMKLQTKAGDQCVEGLYNMSTNTVQMMYSHHLTDNSALTSRISWRVGSSDVVMASVGYRYLFGKHVQMCKSICGEIAADGNIRQMITFPILGNMMMKFYAEINHFLAPQQMQQGQMPHKFGFQLNIHL